MTTSQERRLGDRVAREMYRDLDYVDDPVIAEYVQGLWQPLLDAARARGELSAEMDQRYAWQVLLGKDRMINAFAVPGGWLGLQLGLINVTTSRDEIASVLAHELSHVTQRHISRIMAQESRQAPLVLVGMLLGMLAMSRNPEAGNAVITSTQAMSAQSGLNFSRDMEREADRIGYGVAVQAGFDPRSFASMFEKLQQASRHTDNASFPYLRTHPLNTERIADMQSRAQFAAGPATARATLEHALVVARSRAVSAPGVDEVRVLLTEAGTLQPSTPPTRRAAILYAGALAAARLRDFERADALVQQLRAMPQVQADPAGTRFARLLATEVALLAGQPARAQAALGDVAGTNSRAELLLWAQVRTATGGASDVAQRLQSWVALNKRDATAWQMLSAAYGVQGLQVRAVRADAEARAAQMDFSAALDRFRAAQDLARRGGPGADYIESSIIDSRTREVQSLLREQALER
ncbi:M48 family metalloprotease [Ramlibacter sp. CrO1]|uniref:M48 family metalloprotease n=2 Tax=Ramlibacter algicola TaxID=2795217 RepID=A0A934UQ45_9BURK|nr:M48 family metalloprotease [Ramlibacter algicola]